MKHISSWLVPASLALCAALVIGALAWITQGTLDAERERAQADARADVQERTRLALWRMDSLGAALLLDESGIPDVESRLPVKFRFTVSPAGKLQTKDAEFKDGEFRKAIIKEGNVLDVMCDITKMPAPAPVVEEVTQQEAKLEKEQANYSVDRLDQQKQVIANQTEQALRSKAVQSTLWNANYGRARNAQAAAGAEEMDMHPPGNNAADGKRRDTQLAAESLANEPAGSAPAPAAAFAQDQQIMPPPLADASIADFASDGLAGQPRVAWVDGLLLLARRVGGQGTDAVFDGAWVDDSALRALLLAETGDLLATARLVAADGPTDDGMVLASFPFRLEVPDPMALPIPLRRSTVVSLVMSWTAALIALSATMWLVRGVMRLSERRASFVSAVTHELRTPLTTFRLYSDMLESGAVKEEKRGDYLRVLSREADRLTHLVENVLAFSRIERGNARSQVRDVDADELLENMRERLEARLESAGLHLALDVPRGLRVRADQTAVDHILFNLIDNAAKYAASGDPPVVTITATRAGGSVCLRIRDHGPGIPAAEMRRIFRPFHKSAHEAAETKPGVGLGLALSRRLAKEQGGELSCLRGEEGACFELRLPAVNTV